MNVCGLYHYRNETLCICYKLRGLRDRKMTLSSPLIQYSRRWQ